MLKSHANATVRPPPTTLTLITRHTTPRQSTVTTNTDTADKRNAVRFDDPTRLTGGGLVAPSKDGAVRMWCERANAARHLLSLRRGPTRWAVCSRTQAGKGARARSMKRVAARTLEAHEFPAQVQERMCICSSAGFGSGTSASALLLLALRLRALAAILVVTLMLMIVLNIPAVVSVAVIVVRVRGAARAREEGPAAHSGDVTRVEDPY